MKVPEGILSLPRDHHTTRVEETGNSGMDAHERRRGKWDKRSEDEVEEIRYLLGQGKN